MAEDPTKRQEAVVRNEARFRELNEQARASNAAHVWVDPPLPDWSCECGWESCTAPVRLSPAEYDAVRAFPARFFILPDEGHVAPDCERVVERHPTYWVVEKIGTAAALTAELDPRERRA